MRTFVGVNDPTAVKKWAAALGVAVNKASYFTRSMMGTGKDSKMPIQRLDDLESGPGDEVTVTLLMPSSQEPTIGDTPLEGREESLKHYTDKLRVDQVRAGWDRGSRMTQKRTIRDLRSDIKDVATGYWKRLYDELFFCYLSGSRGTQSGYVWPANSPFFQVNPLTAPDAMHQMYGGTATSKASITTSDGFDLRLIDRAVAKAETMGGDGSDEISMVPCEVEGEERFVMLMHTFQFDALKSTTATGQWLDIQKAASAAQGQKNPIFTGSEGMYAGVIIHKHRNVVGWSDAGASSNLPMRRALFMGAQAAVMANGMAGGTLRFRWTEQEKDHENTVAIGTHTIVGVKKSTYKSKDGSVSRDFGVVAVDTYAKDAT